MERRGKNFCSRENCTVKTEGVVGVGALGFETVVQRQV